MKLISFKIEMAEILIICATALHLYDKIVISYIFLGLGLFFSFVRSVYDIHQRDEEKKRNEKNNKEFKQLLLKNITATKSSSPTGMTH